MSQVLKINTPIFQPRVESEASHLLVDRPVYNLGNPLGEVEVKPGEQSHISLGDFHKFNPQRNFYVHLNPTPQDEDAIVTQMTQLMTSENQYELVLHIANYDRKTICAEVWQL